MSFDCQRHSLPMQLERQKPILLVTTPYGPNAKDEQRALRVSEDLDLKYVERKKDTIANLCRIHGAKGSLVVGAKDLFLTSSERSYRFHPSMALHRLSFLRHGKKDRYLEVSGIQEGDRVLDCTCGMASDALVASCKVGKRGAVVALESNPILHLLVQDGLSKYQHRHQDLVDSMRKLEVLSAEHGAYLASLESKSFDVVYLDPMFHTPFTKGRGLDLVQLLSDRRLPNKEVLAQALRVARRRVVIKDRVPGKLLAALKPQKIEKSRKIWYGVWESSQESIL